MILSNAIVEQRDLHKVSFRIVGNHDRNCNKNGVLQLNPETLLGKPLAQQLHQLSCETVRNDSLMTELFFLSHIAQYLPVYR